MAHMNSLFAVLGLLLTTCAAAADPPSAQSGSSQPPLAQDEATCTPWQRTVIGLRGADPAAQVVDVADGREAAELLAFLNAIPPASHVDGDRVAVVFVPKQDKFVFIAGAHDCATGIMEVPRDTIEQMVGIPI